MDNKCQMFALLKQRGSNQLDDLTLGLVNSMRYSDPNVVYPRGGDVQPGDGIDPSWFYAIYRGSNGFSELTAINQYVSQEALYEDISEMLLGIALVEMKHLDKLGDLITDLGGEITQKFDTSHVEYGSTARQAVELGIEAESATIGEYNKILEQVKALPENQTTLYVLQLLAKLIADETFHLNLFKTWLKENPDVA